MISYYTLNDYLKSVYHTKVYKISLSTGCSCPNRDGRISYGGCCFCSEGGSGDFAENSKSITEQIKAAKERVNCKFPKTIDSENRKYIAYFQSFTNTYGEPERLLHMFMEAASDPAVVIISIGTRPDCLQNEILDVIERVNKVKTVWIELGLQTSNDITAEKINRGYTLSVFEDSYYRLKKMKIYVVVHLIFGLPGESEKDMMNSVKYISNLIPHPDGVKLQLLHILKGTRLGDEYLEVLDKCGGDENKAEMMFPVLTLDEYCHLIFCALKILPEDISVHRITGDGPRKLLLAPHWSMNKKHVLNTIRNYREDDKE